MSLYHPMFSSTFTFLPGIQVYGMTGKPRVGVSQDVLIYIDANGEFPVHSHSRHEQMIIVQGSGIIISKDELNGKPVARADVIEFAKGELHGFKAGPEGLSFLSRNEGIVDEDGDWDINFA